MVSSDQDRLIEGAGLENVSVTANQLLQLAEGCKVWLFDGEMGAGKTTIIKAICAQLGVEDNVTSPTFSIVNEYLTDSEPVYHFDFYRVKTVEEAINAGVEDYFYSGNYCFIEWPEIIVPLLPSEYLKISIEAELGDLRKYKLLLYGTN